jgi:hypothetical protein
MCSENHVCFGRIHLREGAKAGLEYVHVYVLEYVLDYARTIGAYAIDVDSPRKTTNSP